MTPRTPASRPRSLKALALWLALVALAAVLACTQPSPNEVEHVAATSAALTGSIVISGQARNAAGSPLPGVAIQLSGASHGSATTDSGGNYAFAALPQGSYVVQASLFGCGFVPSTATLANLTTNTVQNFDGSGLTCGGAAQGILTIAGTVSDAAGNPLPGVAVALLGPSPAAQTTGPAGTFSFPHSLPGSYTVQPVLLNCGIPAATLNNLTDSINVSIGGSGSACPGPALAPITISGQVRDAQGNPLVGVTVGAVGPTTPAPVTSDASGHYSFTGLTAGSYVVTPTLLGCAFVPGPAILGNLIANTTQDFDGSGLTCGGAASGRLTIAGQINDANGLPLSGVHVQLVGTLVSPQTTGASGAFSFAGLVPGAYVVQPQLAQCTFNPQTLILGSIADSATARFSGSGPGCGGAPSVNAGATTGSLTIGGHVVDGSGNAIVGVQINLTGAAQATRFTDHTGGYNFSVAPGTYTITTYATCSISPQLVVTNVGSNFTQNFTATSSGCATASTSQVGPSGQVMTVTLGGTIGMTYANIENYSTTQGAVARLQNIGIEAPSVPLRSVNIAGLPAVERQVTLQRTPSQMEEEGEAEIPGGAGVGGGPYIDLTTAIASGTSVIRFDTTLPSNASSAVIAAFFGMVRDFTPAELSGLHGPAPVPVALGPVVPPATPSPAPPSLLPSATALTFGEVAIAAADSSNAVVYASNGTHSGLRSGEVSYSIAGSAPATSTLLLNPGTTIPVGDPTMAVGAPDSSGLQRFYFSEIYASGTNRFGPFKNVVFRSTDATGSTFQQTAEPVIDCADSAAGCTLADQAQLAADRRTPSAMGDQLYLAWRNFPTAFMAQENVQITCSNDGGTSWRPIQATTFEPGTDFPRMSVGRDGEVYILDEDRDVTGHFNIWIHKFSPCSKGFTQEPNFPVNIATGILEHPDLAGLDRQPNGGQYMVVPDDSDTTGQRLFVVFSSVNSVSGALGNDDIKVAESLTGGAAWTIASSSVSSSSTGYKFFPWACSTQGNVYVSWYDRRDATAAKPDLTAFRWSHLTDTTNSGTPTISGDYSASGPSTSDDAQCGTGFLADQNVLASVTADDQETMCADLPSTKVTAGMCTNGCDDNAVLSLWETSGTSSTMCGSLAPCDLRSTTNPCASGERCVDGFGGPKYGDYDMNACARGLAFFAWASASPPPAVTCHQAGASCSSNSDCCEGTCTGGFCIPVDRSGCKGNGTACSKSGDCCSLNCLTGTCLPGINVYAYSTSCTSCAGTSGCTDLANSSTNCGACGHSCGGGACTNGQCQPVLLWQRAPNAGGAMGLASDGTNLYFSTSSSSSTNSQLLSIPVALPTGGGLATPTVLGTATTPGFTNDFHDVAVDPTGDSPYVYTMEMSSKDLFFAPRLGSGVSGGLTTDTPNTTFGQVGGITASAGKAYVALNAGGTAAIMVVPSNSTTPTLVANAVFPVEVAVDATNAYWTDINDATGNLANNVGTVMKAPLAGGTPVTLATGQAAPLWITTDGTNVYWMDVGATAKIMKVSVGGGTPTTLATSKITTSTCCAYNTNLVLDGAGSLYFGDQSLLAGGGGGLPTLVYSVPTAGGTPAVFAVDTTDFVSRLAADAKSIFWTDGSQILKDVHP